MQVIKYPIPLAQAASLVGSGTSNIALFRLYTTILLFESNLSDFCGFQFVPGSHRLVWTVKSGASLIVPATPELRLIVNIVIAITSTPPSRQRRKHHAQMSLFGTSPEAPSSGGFTERSKVSLFADEPATGGSSLFAEDDGNDSSSPWNIQNNTAKRAAQQNLARTLLPADVAPKSYIHAYKSILNSEGRVGSGIGLTSVRNILSTSRLSATDQSKILNLVVSSANQESFSGLGQAEFNVLLALIGLAQEGEDLSFDAVDDRRKSGSSLKSYKAFSITYLTWNPCRSTPARN